MTTKELGNLKIIQEGYPVGLLLREKRGIPVLEEYFDTSGENMDTVHIFDGEDLYLNNKEDLLECLAVARCYEPDKSVPIYIKIDTSWRKELQERRERCIRCVVEASERRPWNPMHSMEKCKECNSKAQ